ncbi:unnamed protein product [Linum trigynum]|uniref:Uncharacterized protein n=1 Tax=Linum trigynum TaxID=586398 RepID=A0AAV2GQH9_9ROSI
MVLGFSKTFTGTLFHDPIPANAQRHSISFAHRPFIPTHHIPFAELIEYGLDVTGFVHNLGWDFLINDTPEHICPEGVRLFFSNFRSFGLHTRTFTTLIYGNLVTIPLENLRRLLNIPRFGEILANDSEFPLFNFDIVQEFVLLTGHEPDAYLTLPTAFLFPSLHTFHYLLTRRFLPRTVLLDRVTPLDLWVLQHAVQNVPLDYCHLLFGHLYPFQQFEYLGHLPLGPLITRLIIRLHISLDPFRIITPNVYLSADDILDEIALAVEGEDADAESDSTDSDSSDDDGPMEEPDKEDMVVAEPEGDDVPEIEVHWVSSNDKSDSSNSDDDSSSSAPSLAEVLADLRDAYYSE